MKPQAFLRKTTKYLFNLEEAQRSAVFVGLPQEKVGDKIYKDNDKTIIEVGASHEFGEGVPMRSFLRVPFALQEKQIEDTIDKQFKAVFLEGRKASTALGRIGADARNIVIEAFRSGGFGTWPDITERTKEEKGSSKILINTATLRNSITWVIR